MGRDKGLILWKGKTLAENAIEILASLCNDIFISTNSPHFNSLNYPVIQDQYADCGPMGGILSCLNQSDTDLNLVIPIDVPFITSEIYLRLLEHNKVCDIIVPVDHKSWYQPLCSVFNRSIIPAMEDQLQNSIYGFTPLIRKVNALEVPFTLDEDPYQEQTFLNINSPADLVAII
jgi:molybdopterin-guanine dinucleotide biosynthesis protein A